MLFVLIWLAGDLCNLFGGILAGLLPTIIILAAYVSPDLKYDITVQLIVVF